MMSSGPVVVGVDGSESSFAAVEAAAREARERGLGLRVVHALVWPVTYVLPRPSPGGTSLLGPPPMDPSEAGLRKMAADLVTEAVGRARAVAPDVQVGHAVVSGEPLTVLQAESRAAELVVVGSRGLGGFVGLLAGSTAVHLVAHGQCPVMVVREEPRADGPVLLGVDGSAAGGPAVDFAFATAERRKAPLLALHAWTTWNAPLPAPQDASAAYARLPGALAEEEETLLSEALAGCRARYPDVVVERRVVHGRTREALIGASRSAQLTVVGARGRGGFAGLLLGSVSQAVLHHAHCPVVVVRAPGARH